MDQLQEDDYPELFRDLADKLAGFLQADGIAPARAADIAGRAAEYVRKEWGGQQLYVTKGVSYDCSRRDHELFEKFRGDNHDALAREYDLTLSRVYQIIKAVRQEMLRKKQQPLF